MAKSQSYRTRRGRKSTRVARKLGTKRYRRKQLRNKTSIPMGLGFPKRMVMTHKYAETLNLTSPAGVIGKHLFSCNGMFDPNITGVGHQPMYFDQVSSLYNHYTVIASKMKITVSSSAANDEIMYVGTWIDDDTTTTNITDVGSLAERTSGRIRQMSPGSNKPLVFSNKWSAKKTFGGSILGNDNLQGTVAGNPTEQSYFGIGVVAGNADTVVAQLLFEITYIAVWSELKDVAQS